MNVLVMDIKSVIERKSVAPELGRSFLKEFPLAIEEFEKLIEEDEEIIFVSNGSIKGKNRRGMIFFTNKRVVVVLKLIFAHVEQFQYENITAVDYKVSMLMLGEIHISSYGTSKVIYFSHIGRDGEYLRKVVDYIKNKMLEAKKPQVIHIHNNEQDFITQLERLAKLKEQGILTEDEFIEQKRKLLL